eukprot:scaffold9780_cov80-Skeletonema_marinoi.AAC.1
MTFRSPVPGASFRVWTSTILWIIVDDVTFQSGLPNCLSGTRGAPRKHNRRKFVQSTFTNNIKHDQHRSATICLLPAGIDRSSEWEKFRSFTLEPSPAHFRARTNIIAQTPELNGMTLLHATAKCNPPPELVLDMIEICPDLLAARDCLGRTPLHVAAGSGVAPLLIQILAHVYPSACDVQDVDGKTPLHFACDSSSVLFEDDHNNESATHLWAQQP